MKLRYAVLATSLAVLCACSAKPPNPADAAKLIGAHPDFAAPVTKLPLAPDIVETSVGVDAGVIEGLWRYGARDATGHPQRVITEKGKQDFLDATGTLATPARRELVAVTTVTPDKDNAKHAIVDFTWHYQTTPGVQRYTGLAGTYTGKAELQYDGGWKVTSLKADAKPTPFLWTAALVAAVRPLLAAENEATTQRMLALEPQKFTSPSTSKRYTVTVADVQVSMEEETSRRTVSYLDFMDCGVADAPGSVTLRIDGIRQSIVADGPASARADFERLCATTKEAQQTWAAHNREVADRGPLGVSYAR